MNNRNDAVESPATESARATDTSGQPVDVVQRDLQDEDRDAKGVDEALTPSSTRAKEQDVEALNRKTAEIERKVADGN